MSTFLEELDQSTLAAYNNRPRLIAEHHSIEQTVLAGGYGYRQVLELVQNEADAALEDNEQNWRGNTHIYLNCKQTYVANSGAPFTHEG